MDETPQELHESSEAVRENRVLAAIVFTDAVAFSKLAGRDEKAAYAILNRDFDLMTGFCRSNGGRVLNTMGDGMLMCFGSAVDAMQCALKIQQALHVQAQSLPTISVLQHRIGVHLGDIIIDGENVFGDGVNVAARLQAECRPGAICYSRMVADVIKNKVQIRGRFLGPRHLKNIIEPVPVYEVPSLSEYVTEHDPFDEPVISGHEEGASGSRATLMVVASVVLVGAVIFAAMQLTRGKNSLDDPRVGRTKSGRGAQPSPSTTPSTTTPAVSTKAQLDPLRARYDFAGMLQVLEAAPGASAETDRVRGLVSMRAWLDSEISAATASKPIATPDGARAYRGTRGVVVESSTGIHEMAFEEIPPATLLNILSSAVAAPPTGQTPPGDATLWINQFRAEYSL